MTYKQVNKNNILETYLMDDAEDAFLHENYEYAQICCKLAIKINKNSFKAHFLNGCALYFSGNLDKARHAFAKAVKLNPHSQHAKINKGVIECQMGHLSGAEDIEKMHHDRINCGKIFELKAIFSSQKGEYTLAETYFAKAKELLQNKPSVYTNHGTALLEKYLSNQSDITILQKALEQFDYAISNSSYFDKYAYYNRCRTYILLCQYKNALSDANKLVMYDETDPGFIYILAKAQLLCGCYKISLENAFFAHWYGTLFNHKVADEALDLCNEIVQAQKVCLYG